MSSSSSEHKRSAANSIALIVYNRGGAMLQEERTAVSVQEGADLPLACLHLDAPQQPDLWREQYKVLSC